MNPPSTDPRISSRASGPRIRINIRPALVPTRSSHTYTQIPDTHLLRFLTHVQLVGKTCSHAPSAPEPRYPWTPARWTREHAGEGVVHAHVSQFHVFWLSSPELFSTLTCALSQTVLRVSAARCPAGPWAGPTQGPSAPRRPLITTTRTKCQTQSPTLRPSCAGESAT